MNRAQAPGGGDSPGDGSASRLSKNNRQGTSDPVQPSDLPGPSRRPLAVLAGTTLRDEARAAKYGPGEVVPLSQLAADDLDGDPEIQARPTYRVVDEWRRWMESYQNSHIEFESDDGETIRAPLENSYQDRYARRYYAKLKDFERGARREFEEPTAVMLTLTASHRNAEGGWRCPADHLRDVIDGWNTARKQLHQTLSGADWEYVRIVEPHADGYLHVHVGVVIDAASVDRLDAERFRPVMESHVRECESAGSEAHGLGGVGLDDAVSVGEDVDSIAGYLAEYLSLYNGESALEAPMNEQVAHATTWATNTRRLDFSNGAQAVIADEQFRRETGLRPEDRGEAPAAEQDDDGIGWEVTRLCEVEGRSPDYYDPTSGGVEGGPIDGRDGVDPPKRVG